MSRQAREPITSEERFTINKLRDELNTPFKVEPLKREFTLRKLKGVKEKFTNPLTGRLVANTAVSRYRVNKQIRAFNEIQEANKNKNELRKNLGQSKIVDAFRDLATMLLDLKDINTVDDLYRALKIRFEEIKKSNTGWQLGYVKVFFKDYDANGNPIAQAYSFKSDYLDMRNGLDFFKKIINDKEQKFKNDNVGSDAYNINLANIDFEKVMLVLVRSGAGKKFKTLFNIENVNKTEEDIENRRCIENCFSYAGIKVNNLKTIIEVVDYIKENDLPIMVIENEVCNISLNYDKVIEVGSNIGCNINDCKYSLNVLYEPENYGFIFVYGDDHLDVIKNNDKLFRDDVLINYQLNVIDMNNNVITKRKDMFKKALKCSKNECENFELEYVFFDYETVVDYSYANCMKPYSISWFNISHTDVENFDFSKNELITSNCHNYIGWDCSEVFYKWIMENQVNKRFVLISYNGANFDNFILLKSFLEISNDCELSIISKVQYNGNQLLNFKINGRHTLYDLHKHLMGSLKSNCESFKVPSKYSKLECDHNEIQSIYNNDNSGFIETMKQRDGLSEYNNNDVLALCCLFIKYYQSLNNIQGLEFLRGKDFTNTTTIGSIIMKRAKEHWKDKEEFKSDLLDVKKYQDILKYKIAGRVEVFGDKAIKLNEEVVSLDVCSLYPYIMFIHPSYFPSGNIIETNDYFKPEDKLGFWYCDIDQRALKKHGLPNIYAEKTETENKWGSDVVLENYLISNITIELLKRYENIGVKVNIKNGFYWSNKVRGFDMFNFLAPLMQEKNKQDELKKKKSPDYNPALREVCKLLMNSISGKVIEGLHNENVKMVNQSQLCSMMVKHKDLNFINNIDENVFVSYSLPDEMLIKRQSPIFLGAFIYEYARTYMWNNLLSKLGNSKCLYMDTDAVKFRKSDVPEWMNIVGNKIVPHWDDVEAIDARYKSHILYNENSKVFGSFENELHDNNLFFALQKKIWLTAKIENDGSVSYIKTRYKGVNPRSFLLGEADKLNVDNYLECFNWCMDNQDKMIKNDYEGDAEDMGKQLEFFNQLYENGYVNVLCTNFKKSVKNNCRQVKITDNDKKNRYNNTIRFIYMIKTLNLNNAI